MKLKIERCSAKRSCRPFMVLPVLKNYGGSNNEMPSKNPGLKLFTKTWSPKSEEEKEEEAARPLTATLEKPVILDINFIRKIDMSKVRKEFLNITNLCKVPLIIKNKKRKSSKSGRPLSQPSTANSKKKVESTEDSKEDEGSASVSIKSDRKTLNDLKKLGHSKHTKSKFGGDAIPRSALSDANNNTRTAPSTTASFRKGGRGQHLNSLGGVGDDVTKAAPPSIKQMPEPCTACGRPNQPERFHSHPARTTSSPYATRRRQQQSQKMKSIVQKPVAIKFKSKQTNRENKPSTVQKPSLPAQVLVHTPPSASDNLQEKPVTQNRVRSGKRTLTCYICGREFGTASLHLHEPKCLEKFHRENSLLPVHLRRKLPPKPDKSVSAEEWNNLAWEASQSTLTPCGNCGRTFYPDRLIVHQRSCKSPPKNKRTTVSPSTSSSMSSNSGAGSNRASPSAQPPHTPSAQPPTVLCYICGRPFGTHSIAIHERQCLRKWHQENDQLPPDMRSAPPTRNDPNANDLPHVEDKKVQQTGEERHPSASKKPPLFPCYLCGKLFTVNSIYIHEPQCLKKWKAENDKLPPHKRRPIPMKPDIKFTQDGKVDIAAMHESNWQTHLSQLIPCKLCRRTFNPDRVDVHERSCKGI